MDSQIAVFTSWLNSGTVDPDGFVRRACGISSTLWWAVQEARNAANAAEQTTFLEALRSEGLRGRARSVITGNLDPTIGDRLNGFADSLEAVLSGTDFGSAATAFECTWVGERSGLLTYHSDPDRPDAIADAHPQLPLSRVGGWVVYDTLWHFQHSQPGRPIPMADGILAREETPIIVVGGVGQVIRLVVELLPGPAGLVTPDWWPMGLMQFPQPDAGMPDDFRNRFADFVASTHRVLTAVAVGKAGRLRWRLEPRNQCESSRWLPVSLEGRSAEAAVASVGLAVYERAAYPADPVLNPSVSVTARVEGEQPNVSLRRLDSVWSLQEKCRAAGAAGLSEVVVASDPGRVILPDGLRLTAVDTVNAAYFELQMNNVFIRNYQQLLCTEYDDEWYPEITP